MPDSYDQPGEPRGRTEYTTRYRGISAHDRARQANFNSAGDRRSYQNRSVSRDRKYRTSIRSRQQGGNIYALINVSHNSLVDPSKEQSYSTPPNPHLVDHGNDRPEYRADRGRKWIKKEETVRIGHQEATTGKPRRERQQRKRGQPHGVDASRNRERASGGGKTGLIVTLLTVIVSTFAITKSLSKQGPPFQSQRENLSPHYRDDRGRGDRRRDHRSKCDHYRDYRSCEYQFNQY